MTKSAEGVSQSIIDSLPVTVEAILGIAEVRVGELSSLSAGETFKLDTLLGDSVELRINGGVIACGELVSVGDHFAVRIQAIARP